MWVLCVFQVKYSSRAAQLYREKLHQAAAQAMRLHGTKVTTLNSFFNSFLSVNQPVHLLYIWSCPPIMKCH